MRDAQSLLEQVLVFAQPGDGQDKRSFVDESMLQKILGLAERRVLYQLSMAVLRGDAQRCVELVAELVNQGRDPARLSRDLVEHFRNLLVARLTKDSVTSSPGKNLSAIGNVPLLDLPDHEITDLIEQAQSVSVEMLLDYFDFMAAGDEEIGRSAMPRFALEAALVRLATLPKALPVAELIERLERLERKAVTVVRPDASMLRVKERPAAAAQVTPAPSPSETANHRDESQVWQEFVAFVSKEQKFLASHLASGSALTLPPGQLHIGVSERHHLAFLQDSDNLATLKELARRFFAQDVTVQIASAISDSASKSPEMTSAGPPTPTEERSPMVKEALRIFGGSIRNVRRDG
jgi:DNA polymerase-3 subunit gamma/tau